MSEFLDFVKAWAKLIGGVFGDYPLAAAIVTLIAVGLFFGLEHRAKSKDWGTRAFNFFIALIGWAIVVPILGFIFNVFGKAWAAAEGTASAFGSVSLFVYHVYENHPLVVLLLLVVAILVFFVWHLLRPRSPSRPIKAIACISLFLVSVAVGAPIANLVSPTSGAANVETNAASSPEKSNSAFERDAPQAARPSTLR